MATPRSVTVLGSTGSVGTRALEVIRSAGGFEVVGLVAGGGRTDLLVEQIREMRPSVVGVVDRRAAREVAERTGGGVEVIAGPEAPARVAEADADIVLNAVVGFAGLGATVATLRRGATLALANKESLIAGGPVVRAVGTGVIVPVDSEHAAVHQCLQGRDPREVRRIILTASGGPFRGRTAAELAEVTVEDALAHPTWDMGPKITVDSSTLMNKGLEVIEAHELFGVPYERIEVVVHPQSVVHSMVELSDGSTIAQLGAPDMRQPISYALHHPARGEVAYGALDWTTVRSLTFEPPDTATFRCLSLAYRAGRAGGSAPAWLNAANEVAVAAFLAGRIRWLDIPGVIEGVLDLHDGAVPGTVDDVIEADRRARSVARRVVERIAA